MPKFRDIPQLTRAPSYAVDVGWDFLERHLTRYWESYEVDLDPDFQRAHVWTREQQIRYVEFILRGGQSGRDIYFNHPHWMGINVPKGAYNDFVIVDGKQRLHAVRRFLNNEIPAFDTFYKDFEDRLPMTGPGFKFHVNTLKTKQEVLTWYLEFNAGGTPHTEAELNKVRNMLAAVANPIPDEEVGWIMIEDGEVFDGTPAMADDTFGLAVDATKWVPLARLEAERNGWKIEFYREAPPHSAKHKKKGKK